MQIINKLTLGYFQLSLLSNYERTIELQEPLSYATAQHKQCGFP